MAVKIRESVLAVAKAVATSGAVKRKVRIVEGAERARRGSRARESWNLEVEWGVVMRRVEM
jgi:hypothetical protein